MDDLIVPVSGFMNAPMLPPDASRTISGRGMKAIRVQHYSSQEATRTDSCSVMVDPMARQWRFQRPF